MRLDVLSSVLLCALAVWLTGAGTFMPAARAAEEGARAAEDGGVAAGGPQPAAGAAGADAASTGPGQKASEAAQELARGNTAKAIAAYTEALKDTGLANDRRAAILNDRAVALAKAGEAKLALDDYNAALKLFAEYAPAYNNRGNLLVMLGQYEEAIKDYDRAILLAPKYAAAFSNRANARLKLGRQAQAIADFTRAIELSPQSAPPLSGRGLAHLATGKPHAAIRDFSRAVNADARFATAYRNRAEARLVIGQGEEAIEDLSRAAAFDGNNAELYIVRGYAYLDAANVMSAIKDFSRAIELAPSSVAAYEARGLANGMAEAYDAGFADLNRAIELDPRSAIAFAYRAYLYKQTQQLDVAQKDMSAALKLDAENAQVQWALGEMEEARGRPDAAVAAQRKAAALKPGWKMAQDALKRLGAGDDTAADEVVAGAGTGNWRVVARKATFFAVSDDFPSLRIPLEMMGEGTPKLLAWELKKEPFKGYGVLRFGAGRVIGTSGPEETEQSAIVDIDNAKVIAIQPSRQGNRVATWTWEDDRVQIASIDGVTDEFSLRMTAPAVAEPAIPGSTGPSRRAASKSYSGSTWSPWGQPFGMGEGDHKPRRSASSQQRRHQPKPKSIFDLLFN
ncbi:MAG TPA: tetratricopeptide repeat protein [Hyphomicrobium sp.]|mgnify:FL=1|nr:tetratricopeptide repeat protein [Hyphomicrobium sp.]